MIAGNLQHKSQQDSIPFLSPISQEMKTDRYSVAVNKWPSLEQSRQWLMKFLNSRENQSTGCWLVMAPWLPSENHEMAITSRIWNPRKFRTHEELSSSRWYRMQILSRVCDIRSVAWYNHSFFSSMMKSYFSHLKRWRTFMKLCFSHSPAYNE